MLSGSFSVVRKTTFNYHSGFRPDVDGFKGAKEKLKSLLDLDQLNSSKPIHFNAYLL
jgi:hypothetical protein